MPGKGGYVAMWANGREPTGGRGSQGREPAGTWEERVCGLWWPEKGKGRRSGGKGGFEKGGAWRPGKGCVSMATTKAIWL